jgi:FG-GAP-like repeat
VDWSDPNLRFVDLDGDGHADVLITEHDALTWYPSLANSGFGAPIRVSKPQDEDEGPAIIFANASQSMFLADMSGDGLTDIVRIRNGEVCYWPNLGYGRFGRKVTMDNAPWFDSLDLFDPARIRLADIDRSATTDIIYIGSDGIRLYFNQAGNGVGAAVGAASGVAQSALYSAGNAWSCDPFGAAGPAATGTRRLAGPRREAQDELGCGENAGARPSGAPAGSICAALREAPQARDRTVRRTRADRLGLKEQPSDKAL